MRAAFGVIWGGDVLEESVTVNQFFQLFINAGT